MPQNKVRPDITHSRTAKPEPARSHDSCYESPKSNGSFAGQSLGQTLLGPLSLFPDLFHERESGTDEDPNPSGVHNSTSTNTLSEPHTSDESLPLEYNLDELSSSGEVCEPDDLEFLDDVKAKSEENGDTSRSNISQLRISEAAPLNIGEELPAEVIETPIKKWAGLKRKLRYPLPNNFQSSDWAYAGHLTVYDRTCEATHGAKKAKRRWVVIVKDMLYVMKKSTASDASDVLTLESCVVDSMPRGVGRLATSAFGIYAPPPSPTSFPTKGTVNALPIIVKYPTRLKKRCYVMIAPNEMIKMVWMTEIIKGMDWRGHLLVERGLIPRITLSDHDEETELQVFPQKSTPRSPRHRSASVQDSAKTIDGLEVKSMSAADIGCSQQNAQRVRELLKDRRPPDRHRQPKDYERAAPRIRSHSA
ncbi:hypothetical protein DFS34DRAFT_419093 [Phlyctochytrium arcticum]|nr:hypothetical protein DFS34DRAFT_419093 [Phlyctochytrium arcticum]